MKLFTRNPEEGLIVLDSSRCGDERQVRLGRTRVLWFKYWERACVPFKAWTESNCWCIEWRHYGFEYEWGASKVHLDSYFGYGTPINRE